MKITKEWLVENGACSGGRKWFSAQKTTDGVKVIKKLMKEDRLDWANWTIIHLMNREQKIQYAVFAAEQVLGLYEKQYPGDDRPRKAIEAARKCIADKSADAADAAADAADAAADAADAAAAAYVADAAYAAYAARAAARAADAVADAADAAAAAYVADAADAAADAVADAAAGAAMKAKILKYGIGLLEGKEGL